MPHPPAIRSGSDQRALLIRTRDEGYLLGLTYAQAVTRR
jgi:hypothetical protein